MTFVTIFAGARKYSDSCFFRIPVLLSVFKRVFIELVHVIFKIIFHVLSNKNHHNHNIRVRHHPGIHLEVAACRRVHSEMLMSRPRGLRYNQ